ncbi:MAG: sigma-70 family RNA polymerase sigma factor [Clostridia bacterium]|nr:sigma-70 family RNA polymerase sigma factor [Clostridia bacterium]
MKYCIRILHNEICDIYREQNRKHANGITIVPLEYADNVGVWDEYFQNEHIFNVLGQTVSVKSDQLADAIEKLPQDKRDIILLSYFLGMSDKDIGRNINTIPQTVFQRRHRALRLLRKVLRKEERE